MCSCRKRNWRFRLDRSIVSRSTTWISPKPQRTRFFNSSQPMPPAPTMSTRAYATTVSAGSKTEGIQLPSYLSENKSVGNRTSGKTYMLHAGVERCTKRLMVEPVARRDLGATLQWLISSWSSLRRLLLLRLLEFLRLRLLLLWWLLLFLLRGRRSITSQRRRSFASLVGARVAHGRRHRSGSARRRCIIGLL